MLDDNGMAQAHKGELRRCDAPVADATTPRVVGLVERASLVAHTGRGHRRWDRRELEMPQDARDHRLLGDDGNNPQRPLMAKRTGGHIQTKDAAQQPGPRPVRGARGYLLPVQPLLAWRGNDAPAHVAVRRQAAAIAYQVDMRQGYERGQLLQELQR